jgi:hypothetical protein
MGVCKTGYTSIHSLVDGDLSKWDIEHTSNGEHQFWKLSFPLVPGYEGKVDELQIGRIKNVQGSIRMTRERYRHSNILMTGYGGCMPIKRAKSRCRVIKTRSCS